MSGYIVFKYIQGVEWESGKQFQVQSFSNRSTFKICLNIPDNLKRIVCKALNHDINFV